MPRRDPLAFAAALALALGGAFAGCRCQGPGEAGGGAPAASSARLPAGIPVSASVIASVLNPFHAPRYEGPLGTVAGVVRVEGDAPPPLPGARALPAGCNAAQSAYRHYFRKGPQGELADAIVGVTDYPGYLLPRGDAVRASIRECAYSARTYTLTFGQRLEVANEDPKERYLPRLEGARHISQMFAMPGGDPVRLYPTEPGRYALVDDLNHPWLRADVFVLKYPAHAVSRPDGTFRVEGVPAGKVRVHAGHPAIAEGTSREIEVKAGEEAKVELTLTYRAPPAASSSAPGPARPGPIVR
ncbi:MAG TPA: carboxypeptidase-like regulatory domain-containing protein [Polyangiaceae bacterium]|nr:carboxypeptidase-like regulatory domain-containing protein [Polyangiaceae bacterium]